MIEVLAGGNFQKALNELNVEAKRTYHMCEEPHFEVWEMKDTEFKKIKMIPETDWPEEYGWWRTAKGSNMGTACEFFVVNDVELIAWGGSIRDRLFDEWSELNFDEKEKFNHSYKVYEEESQPYKYDTLLEYFMNELGISTETNICALATDLARCNGMTIAKLFETYQGDN